jgi:hypothetical protein
MKPALTSNADRLYFSRSYHSLPRNLSPSHYRQRWPTFDDTSDFDVTKSRGDHSYYEE